MAAKEYMTNEQRESNKILILASEVVDDKPHNIKQEANEKSGIKEAAL